MASILCKKSYGALRPADTDAEEVFRKIKAGDTVSVDIKLKRSVKHLALYWSLVREVWTFLDHSTYPTTNDLHIALKMACGCRKLVQMVGSDKQMWVPDSVAFSSMDQAQFSDFYSKVCDLIATHLLPEVTEKTARSRLLVALGLPPDLER